MSRRIVAEDDEDEAPETPRPNPLRLASRIRRERGPGVFRYDRAVLAKRCKLKPSAIYSAERRGRLDMDDLCSVSRFLIRHLDRRKGRAA